ncbi:energy transducer TonB [Sphingomonas sp. KC8]|uniref:energy transducer TonB n=1 Tax=Sphingomonas sp. KC8 TaxID=1030157 RepID=UPI0002D6C9A5|nr:energy transducer TonB [Sphingomonas sp. KC8]ARS26725.1 TonB-like protein [Sphingomonas sp. KC8]
MNLLSLLMLSAVANIAVQEAKPVGNSMMWVTTEDYPAVALREGMEGASAVQLSISAEGAVTGCSVTASSGHRILDDLTCNLLKLRGQFDPAKDRRGRAMASQYDQRVRWQLPKDGDLARQPAPQPFSMVADFDVSETGEIENCRTSWQTALPGAPDFCAGRNSVPMVPFRDATGKAVRRHVIFRSSVTIEDSVDPNPTAHPPAAAPIK